MQQLQSLTHRHKLIAQYLIMNPTMKKGDVARHFGMGQSYFSIIINSDAFKEYMCQLDAENVEKVVIPLRDKLNGVAHRAVEKLGEMVDSSQDADFLLAAADKTLHRLGFAPSRGPTVQIDSTQNTQNNVLVANADDLERARRLMQERGQKRVAAREDLPETNNINKETESLLPNATLLPAQEV